MDIPLSQFEQFIDESILKKGLRHFENQRVREFTEISAGIYQATVEDAESYTVRLTVHNDIITAHECDCPYDKGPICEHRAAVIFYMQRETLNLELSKAKAKAKTKTSKAKTPKKKRAPSIAKQVDELLETISHEELTEFLREHCKKDKQFRSFFLASFGHLSQHTSQAFYQKQIHAILHTAKRREGWISRSNMKYVTDATLPFVEQAEKHLENQDYEKVFFISAALLEEMVAALQFGDDSSGDLGYFIGVAVEWLNTLTQHRLPETLRKEILTYCIQAFRENRFRGWDWHMDMLKFALELTKGEEEVDTILACLDTVKESSEYERELAQSFHLAILRRFKGEKEAQAFVALHIKNPRIRTAELEKALHEKDFERLIALAEEGIQTDKTDKPGLVNDWYNWLLKAAQAQQDMPKIIEYARYLLMDNFYAKQDYYLVLKEAVEAEKWDAYLEALIQELSAEENNHWSYRDLIREIYTREQWWDRLLLLLKEHLALNFYGPFQLIEHHEPYLKDRYAAELVELYREHIITYLEESVGRSHYRRACKYLRRMQKLGGHQQVNELIALFRSTYSRRPALIQELDKV